MSACADFAEHVWKPGSCKNCFHPQGAHRPRGGGEEGGHYSKPTIAVKPTMMTSDATETVVHGNVDPEQKAGDLVSLRKLQDHASLYIANGYREPGRLGCSPSPLPSPVFLGQEGGLAATPPLPVTDACHRGNASARRADYQQCRQASVATPPLSPTPAPDPSCCHGSSCDADSPAEPVYAQSSKKKGGASVPPPLSSPSPPAAGATIVMAAHTEDPRRTFYLSSPDSAVSTPRSPVAPGNGAFFRWPALGPHAPPPPPRSSPPVPPKRGARSPLPLPPREESLKPLGWGCRIEEEEEEEGEGETVNGAAVCRGPPEPGTAPPLSPRAPDGGACLGLREEGGAGAGSPPWAPRAADATSPPPPPPPPKKHHRACGSMNGSISELDRLRQQGSVESLRQQGSVESLRQQGSVESLTQTMRGLCSASLLTASTDSLIGDAGSRDSPLAPHSPSNRPGNQPPPLPEKKTVCRTTSAPPDPRGGGLPPDPRPRLPSAASEGDVCRASPPPSPSPSEGGARGGRLGAHARGSPACASSPQLSAPTATPGGPAMQLQSLLSNMDSREGVYATLGGLYAESLRRLALRCEERFMLRGGGAGGSSARRFDESSWSLLKLTSSTPQCRAGDGLYYAAACASDPSCPYAVKICRGPSQEQRQAHLYGLSVQQSLPPHFHVQQDCGHFIACVPQSMLPGDEAPPPGDEALPPAERVVVIARDAPRRTAADLVREGAGLHRQQPEAYERLVCLLLLQLCLGLEHLKGQGVTHRHLCLENLLLVEPPPGAPPLPRLLISNFAKAKRRSQPRDGEAVAVASGASSSGARRDHARLAPEIVSAAQYRKFDEFQTGILIYELLHQPNPFEERPALLRDHAYGEQDLPPIPAASLYSPGLQALARLLLRPDPARRIHVHEARQALQGLLWGPRGDLLRRWGGAGGEGGGDGGRQEGLLNWLDVKRALLMMKFAERSLEPERTAGLEDWLCCQYFSSAHPLALCRTARLLYAL